MSPRGRWRMALAALALLAGTASAQETGAAPPAEGKGLRKLPIVEACIDRKGMVASTRIIESSGFPEIDEAAIKVAKANRYKPGVEGGKKMKLSCIRFRVNFVIKDDELPAEAKPETPAN